MQPCRPALVCRPTRTCRGLNRRLITFVRLQITAASNRIRFLYTSYRITIERDKEKILNISFPGNNSNIFHSVPLGVDERKILCRLTITPYFIAFPFQEESVRPVQCLYLQRSCDFLLDCVPAASLKQKCSGKK